MLLVGGTGSKGKHEYTKIEVGIAKLAQMHTQTEMQQKFIDDE